jgi:ABC-2 type transport system ATP-binding protein
MTVRQVMEFVRSFYDDWDENRAEGVLSLMGIPEGGRVGDLSRGQRGRLKVAAAFARRSGIVLMDEPLSGIDQPSRAKILEALFGPRRDASQTVLISTHLVYEVEPYIEDVAFVRDGQVVLEGPVTVIREERGKTLGEVFTEVAV